MSTLNEPTGHPVTSPLPQPPAHYAQGQYAQQSYGQPAPGGHMQPMHMQQAPAAYAPPMGPIGKVRGTWGVVGLSIITLGIYSLYYYFVTHEEMKQHSGEGVGGAIGLVLGLFTGGLVTAFLLPNEIGNLYARQGRARPVSATTGLWLVLGWLILIGPLVWLIKTNGALNAYWRSVGAR